MSGSPSFSETLSSLSSLPLSKSSSQELVLSSRSEEWQKQSKERRLVQISKVEGEKRGEKRWRKKWCERRMKDQQKTAPRIKTRMRIVLERKDVRSIWTLSIQDCFKQSSSLVSRKSEIVKRGRRRREDDREREREEMEVIKNEGKKDERRKKRWKEK